MDATLIDNRVLRLTDEGKMLGELHFRDSTFIHAELKIATGETFDLRPDGLFGTRIRVFSGSADIACLNLTWQGRMRIAYQDGKDYLVAARNTFSDNFLLKDQQGETLVHLVSKLDWRRFVFQYAVTTSTSDHLLIMLGIYLVTYHLATMSGATSGLVF